MPHKLDWYKMAAKAGSVEISIYDQIGQNWYGEGITAKKFERDLKAFGDIDSITLRINSPGGSVFEGNAIYNILRAHAAPVHTVIDGVAASIASVIALAGDTIEMPENAMFMIHNPINCICGNAADMRKMADDLEKIKDSILNVYESRSGLDRAKLSKMMDDETWMTADDAVGFNFADKKTPRNKAVASISQEAMAMFHNVPPGLRPQNVVPIVEEPEPMAVQPETNQAAYSKAEMDAAVQAAVQAAVKDTITPQLQRMNEERLASVKARFDNLAASGNITPAQVKMFASMAEALHGSDATMKLDDEKTVSALEGLFAIAQSMKHDMLNEQVAAGDGQPATNPKASKDDWKPDFSDVPSEYAKCLSGYAMDQYIKQVVMPANKELTYAQAALIAEKDENLAKILDQYDYVPDAN